MIENTKLTALVASRICHDMVEPMSAIIQGLEMIKTGEGKLEPPASFATRERPIVRIQAARLLLKNSEAVLRRREALDVDASVLQCGLARMRSF